MKAMRQHALTGHAYHKGDWLAELAAAPVKLAQDLGAPAILLELEPEAAQLQLRLEPEAVVLGLFQRIQRQAIEVLRTTLLQDALASARWVPITDWLAWTSCHVWWLRSMHRTCA